VDLTAPRALLESGREAAGFQEQGCLVRGEEDCGVVVSGSPSDLGNETPLAAAVGPPGHGTLAGFTVSGQAVAGPGVLVEVLGWILVLGPALGARLGLHGFPFKIRFFPLLPTPYYNRYAYISQPYFFLMSIFFEIFDMTGTSQM
jgi:hypothetical protein